MSAPVERNGLLVCVKGFHVEAGQRERPALFIPAYPSP